MWLSFVPPWQVQGVPVGHHLDDLAINADAIVTSNLHVRAEGTEHGVVLQQVRSLLHASGVVDDDDVERRVLPPMPAADKVASNTSETIDGDLDLRLSDGPRGSRGGTLDETIGRRCRDSNQTELVQCQSIHHIQKYHFRN